LSKADRVGFSGNHIDGNNFLVTIYFHENHTYQGVIQWLDTGLKVHFRSQLEMLNLIQEACLINRKDTLRTWKEASNISVI